MRGLRKNIDESFENPLLTRDKWYFAALSAFSQQYYDDVTLNAILSAANMSKSSFYFKFYDKLDLYLCMMERGSNEKVTFLAEQMQDIQIPDDLFDHLHLIAKLSMKFTQQAPLFYDFWKTYLSDSAFIKDKVRESFSDLRVDVLGPMVDKAIANGQIDSHFDRQFVYDVINLYFTNTDNFIDSKMSEEQAMDKVDQVIYFLRNSLSAKK